MDLLLLCTGTAVALREIFRWDAPHGWRSVELQRREWGDIVRPLSGRLYGILLLTTVRIPPMTRRYEKRRDSTDNEIIFSRQCVHLIAGHWASSVSS